MTLPDTQADESRDSGMVIGDDGLVRPAWATVDPLLQEYYDTEWGMPITDETGVYERLTLEAFQAGLSWATILRKRPNFRKAFDQFNPEIIADYDDEVVERLLTDSGIIRNKAKIRAAVTNARATLDLRSSGGLAEFVWSFRPNATPKPRAIQDIPTKTAESIALSLALKKRGFAFVGPTTMHALMEAIGIVDTHLMQSHRRGCSGIWPS